MGFESILFGEKAYTLQKGEPGFFQDLQLDYLLRIISNHAKDYKILPYFYTLPGEKAVIEYRQQILTDLTNEKVFHAVKRFCKTLQNFRRLDYYADESEEIMQKASFHLEAAKCYWEGVKGLEADLEACDYSSKGLREFCAYVQEVIKGLTENGFEEAMNRASEFFASIRFQLVVEQDRMTIVESGESGDNYLSSLAELLKLETDQAKTTLYDIYPNSLEQSSVEAMLIKLLKKSNSAVFGELKGFYEKYPEYSAEKILRFEEEVQFYLSFIQFAKKTEELGFSLQLPVISGDNFQGSGLYDLALAWKNSSRKYKIVSNSFAYPKNPTFFVVTGPNQGGKTTFARSMGQAVYFTLMGLKGNADFLTVPMFEDIATHFEAEETLLSNSGKLKEEINRLAPMMQQEKRRQFVILNELFTTATTHDALIMGKKVMKHFIEKECYGIYVTHIQELAEESESVVSLVAQIEEGEEQRRTYRILPMKAQGQGYSDSLVKEFELRYEDLIRRLG